MSPSIPKKFAFLVAVFVAGGRSQLGSSDPAGDRVKKAVNPGLRRKAGRWAQLTYQIGQRRAARLMQVGWSTWLYRRKVQHFEGVLRRLKWNEFVAWNYGRDIYNEPNFAIDSRD